ncbi:hypothetical protein CBM2637_A30007 [Cupriavidus taiwanensis]|nr:hypothetical protein CBM2585_A10040 [Cupriavidus taiwanensis]SPA28012.1 hypothetical protein CBM2637_A30007 [Cupriavidus taiwanensis]SPA47516.1 protein of unknown function [Cupriavidus taiwanensis]
MRIAGSGLSVPSAPTGYLPAARALRPAAKTEPESSDTPLQFPRKRQPHANHTRRPRHPGTGRSRASQDQPESAT